MIQEIITQFIISVWIIVPRDHTRDSDFRIKGKQFPGIDIQMKTEEVKIRKSIEKDFELPEEPKKPEY